MADLAGLQGAIETGDRASTLRLTQDAIADGLQPQTILDAMTKAMETIGGRFGRNEIYLPEMLIAVRVMEETTAALETVLVEAGIRAYRRRCHRHRQGRSPRHRHHEGSRGRSPVSRHGRGQDRHRGRR